MEISPNVENFLNSGRKDSQHLERSDLWKQTSPESIERFANEDPNEQKVQVLEQLTASGR